MLLPSKNILFRIHLKYFLLISFLASTMIAILWFPFFFNTRNDTSQNDFGMINEKAFSDYFVELGIDGSELIDWIILFTLIIGLLLIVELLFFWTPSLLEFITEKEKGSMIWRKGRYGIIERWLCYKEDSSLVIVRRKSSSFRGLLAKEFLLEIHLSKDDPRVQHVSSFTGIQKKIETKKESILLKTIDLEYLALHLIQIQAMLSLPFK